MKTRQVYSVTNTLISILAAGVVIPTALVIPGSAKLLSGALKVLRRFTGRQLYSALYRLRKKKLIKMIESSQGARWQLTPRGQKKARRLSARFAIPEKPARWDRKWRLVIFDVPEKKRLARDVLRDRLKFWGFRPLQKSVWVWPYPCREEVEELASSLEIVPYVHVAEVSYLNHYEFLLKQFDLI